MFRNKMKQTLTNFSQFQKQNETKSSWNNVQESIPGLVHQWSPGIRPWLAPCPGSCACPVSATRGHPSGCFSSTLANCSLMLCRCGADSFDCQWSSSSCHFPPAQPQTSPSEAAWIPAGCKWLSKWMTHITSLSISKIKSNYEWRRHDNIFRQVTPRSTELPDRERAWSKLQKLKNEWRQHINDNDDVNDRCGNVQTLWRHHVSLSCQLHVSWELHVNVIWIVIIKSMSHVNVIWWSHVIK